jgi:hypothetical protein
MARTRTSGIRVDGDGRRIIDKNHRGVAIYLRLGPISQEHAERRLADEMGRVNAMLPCLATSSFSRESSATMSIRVRAVNVSDDSWRGPIRYANRVNGDLPTTRATRWGE